MKILFVVFQRERPFEISLTYLAEEAILVVVTLQMLVQQIFPRERFLAAVAGEFVWIHMKRVVSRQIVYSGVLLRANITGEHGPLRVTPLMIP